MWNLDYIRSNEETFKDLYNLCTLKDLLKVVEKEKRKLPIIRGRELSRLQKKDLINVFQKSTNKVIESGFSLLLTKMVLKKSKITNDNMFDEHDILKVSIAKQIYENIDFKFINFEAFVNSIYEKEVVEKIITSDEYELYRESEENLNYRKIEKQKLEIEESNSNLESENVKLRKLLEISENKLKRLKAEFISYKLKNKHVNYNEFIKKVLVKDKLDLLDFEFYIKDDFVSTLICISKHECELNEKLMNEVDCDLKAKLTEEYLQVVMLKYILIKIDYEREGFYYV